MSHSPTAQLGHGTGSGRRTMPTTRSPFRNALVGPGSTTRPRDLCPSTRRVLPRGSPAICALHDLDIRSADADRDCFHQDRPITLIRLGDVFQACCPRLVRLHGDCLHFDFSCCDTMGALLERQAAGIIDVRRRPQLTNSRATSEVAYTCMSRAKTPVHTWTLRLASARNTNPADQVHRYHPPISFPATQDHAEGC